jgi:PAS domain S-box-containing protein
MHSGDKYERDTEPSPSVPSDTPAKKSRPKLWASALITGILSAAALFAIGGLLINREAAQELKSQEDERLAVWASDYRAARYHHEEKGRILMEHFVSIPEVSALHAALSEETDPERAAAIRTRLYERCKEDYQRMQANGLRQLHFHSTESVSLLRMHKPDRFGDSLKGVRPTIDLCNATRRPVFAFEEGRIYNGFRNVFPVFHEGRHVGSVEASFGFGSITDYLSNMYRDRRYMFVVDRSVVEGTVFTDLLEGYEACRFSDRHMVEVSASTRGDLIPPGLPASEIQQVEAAIKKMLHQQVPTGNNPPASSVTVGGVRVLKQPIVNLAGNPVAALIALEPAARAEHIEARKAQFLLILAAGSLLAGALIGLLHRSLLRSARDRQAAAERLRRLAKHVPGVIFELEHDPRTGASSFRFASDSLQDEFGLEPAQVLHSARPFLGRIHTDDLVEFQRTLLVSAASSGEWHCEFRTLNPKDGSWIWRELRASPGRTSTGQIIWYGILTNIQQRRLALEAMEEANRLLVEARDAATDAARAKSEFLANMSHEIRTPMNAVVGMTELLLETKMTQEQSDYVRIIRTGGETLLALINDILDFSKIDAGKLELEQAPFCLRTCIDDSLSMISRAASEKHLQLLVDIDPATPTWILGDVTRVRQMLVNVLANAVKFTPSGSVKVRVQPIPSNREDDRQLVRFSITDTGIGIPKDKSARLFEPFTQADASTTRRHGGTGLGLAICQKLASLHGGRIWFESVEGKGSTFHIEIVLQPISEPPKHSSAANFQGILAPFGQ